MEAVTASVWVYGPIGPSIKTVSLPQNGLRAQRKTIGYNARVNYAYAITCNNNSLNWQKQVETGNLQNSTMDSFTAWTRLASIGNFCNLHTYSIGSATPLSIIFLELVSISHLFCGSLSNPCAVVGTVPKESSQITQVEDSGVDRSALFGIQRLPGTGGKSLLANWKWGNGSDSSFQNLSNEVFLALRHIVEQFLHQFTRFFQLPGPSWASLSASWRSSSCLMETGQGIQQLGRHLLMSAMTYHTYSYIPRLPEAWPNYVQKPFESNIIGLIHDI